MLSFALTILGYGRIAANAVGAWLSRRSLAELACIALVAFALVQHFQLNAARHDRDAWHRQYDAEHAGRIADRESYRKAQDDAVRLNQQQIADRLSQQKANNDAQVSTLNQRLELIRNELRKQQNAAPSGHPNGSPAGPGVESPCRAVDPAWMCLSPEDRLRAAENEERHDELIDLVIKQSEVREPQH